MTQHTLYRTQNLAEALNLWEAFPETQALTLPGTGPVRIQQESRRFNLDVDGIRIGWADVSDGQGEIKLVLNLHDEIVPEHATQAVITRLRPLASHVQRVLENWIAEEARIREDMVTIMGPVDHAKVKVPVETNVANLNALLYPGVAEAVLGQNFCLELENERQMDTITASYGEGPIRFPAFRIEKRRDGDAFIMGRGNRERARVGFVSDALLRANDHTRRLASDPGMIAAARALKEQTEQRVRSGLPDMKFKEATLAHAFLHPDAPRGAYAGETASHRTFANAYIRDDHVKQGGDRVALAFGDGFVVTAPQRYAVRDDLVISYNDAIIWDDRAGSLPGIPEDVLGTLWFAARFTVGEHVPAFLKDNTWADPKLDPESRSSLTPQQRILAAFSL